MTVWDIAVSRGITDIVHFTTNRGLIGSLASGAVKSRARLPREDLLEYVYKPNAQYRRDPEWTDYVNLSITRINSQFFDIASTKWHAHEDVWWCILAFSSEVLTHPRVLFTTTNNMYEGVRREGGAAGLEQLFASRVHQYGGWWVSRGVDRTANRPTCDQAEVLYPKELSMKFPRAVYVVNELHADIAAAQCETLGYRGLEVIVKPEAFR
jgi:hypothetical protein